MNFCFCIYGTEKMGAKCGFFRSKSLLSEQSFFLFFFFALKGPSQNTKKLDTLMELEKKFTFGLW